MQKTYFIMAILLSGKSYDENRPAIYQGIAIIETLSYRPADKERRCLSEGL